jgi:tRNA-dihydrouridine synthase
MIGRIRAAKINKNNMLEARFTIAPMTDWADWHCRSCCLGEVPHPGPPSVANKIRLFPGAVAQLAKGMQKVIKATA